MVRTTHPIDRHAPYSHWMRRNYPKTLSLIVVTAVIALGLSGCIKVDMDMKVGSNEKVDGTFVVALNEGVLNMMGQKPDEFIKSMLKDDVSKDVPKGAKVTQTAYRKNGWAGVAIAYKDMPVTEFSKSAGKAAGGVGGGKAATGQDFVLKKVKDTYEFTGKVDFSTGTSPAGKDKSTEAMMKQFKPEMRIKMTFPGKVISANGKISGNSVTWVPTMGDKLTMTAKAKAS